MDLSEGALSSKEDALFFLFEEPHPPGVDDAPHRNLRAWLLLHAARIACSGVFPDKLVSAAALGLTQGARESEERSWRLWLAPLGAPADTWEALNERMNPASGGYLKRRPEPKHRSFMSAVGRLANGESEPMDVGGWRGAAVSPFVNGLLLPAANASSLERETEEDDVLCDVVLPFQASSGSELVVASHNEATVFEVDPDETTAEHSLRLQSLQLRLGAAARFLPWGTWESLTPTESKALRSLVAQTLANPADATQRLLAALVEVALVTGQSLDRTAQIPINDSLDKDVPWRLDLDAGNLLRQPPRHEAHWRPSARLRGSLNTAAHLLSQPLNPAALDAIRLAARRSPNAVYLGQLRASAGNSLRRQFRAWVKSSPVTARIEGSFLATALSQEVFRCTSDPVLARLLGYSGRQSLPASTVYTAYLEDSATALSAQFNAVPPAHGKSPINIAGSLLDPNCEDLLQCSFAHMADLIEQKHRDKDWIDFHNLVALHWDAALRAATGVRPVDDLWRSPYEFDWDHAEVFVDDKASPFGETGRLIPLPRDLCAKLKADYVDRHIPWVLDRMAESGSPVETVPGLLFVVATRHRALMLEPIQNRHRKGNDGYRYEDPYPVNVFRHRLRTRLHRHGDVDLEVVDTVMGHRDGATLTHGSFTMRVWRRDAEAIRPALTKIFDDLLFTAPPLWQVDGARPDVAIAEAPFLPPAPSSRQDKILAGRSKALEQMRAYIKDQVDIGHLRDAQSPALLPNAPELSAALASDICLLSEEQFDALSLRLLRDEHEMPSAQGAVRYEALIKLADAAWTTLGKRARIRKRYSLRLDEPSPFTALAPRAGASVQALRLVLEPLFDEVRAKTATKLWQALVLTIYDLVLVSRIANLALLDSVIQGDGGWRVVRLRDEFFLEWSPSEDLRARPSAPVLRYAISRRSAWLLQHAIRGKTRRLKAWQETHPWTVRLADAIRPTLPTTAASSGDNLLEYIVGLVDQFNATELPGTVAAYLGGRLLSPSLPWGDWVQFTCGRWVVHRDTTGTAMSGSLENPPVKNTYLDQLPEDDEDEFVIGPETQFVPSRAATESRRMSGSRCARADSAHQLFVRLREHLNGLVNGGPVRRELTAEAMAKEIRGTRAETASSIQLLALWAIDLLLRPGRSRKLAVASVLRYFGALSPRFQSMGYDVELHVLEADEVEEFYDAILSESTVENIRDVHDALVNFHRFAVTAAALPDLDWSVLSVPDGIRLGSPGWIDEHSYLELLHRLGRCQNDRNFAPWQLQSIAILARRFGLRGAEATGLSRSEIRWTTSIESVVVRNNRRRDLKTKASRRVLPLLYKLAPIEQAALSKLADIHALDVGHSDHIPLFGVLDRPEVPIDGLKARALINHQLKLVTGQAASSMHKLRKAFIIDLWTAMEVPHWRPDSLTTSDPEVRTLIADTLLGSGIEQITRRGAWAMARGAGHSSPRTALTSYAHVLSDVAASYVDVRPTQKTWSLGCDQVGAIRLDTDLQDHVPDEMPIAATSSQITPVAALRALLHLGHGGTTSEAADSAGLPFAVVESMQECAAALFERLSAAEGSRLIKRRSDQRGSRRLAANGLLNLVHVNAFSRLRQGLGQVPAPVLQALRHKREVSSSEWLGIVGLRREISMWRPEHFQLAAIAARHLADRSRLVFEMPTIRNRVSRDRILQFASDAGWISNGSSTSQPSVLCDSIAMSSKLPSVSLADEGITIEARAAMRLTGTDAADHVCDGIELVVALLCLNACAASGHVGRNAERS